MGLLTRVEFRLEIIMSIGISIAAYKWLCYNKSGLTYWGTSHKRISGISHWTVAYRIMINDFTKRSQATCTDTRIPTLLIITRFVLWAVRTNYTFRSAGWWTSDKARDASTH